MVYFNLKVLFTLLNLNSCSMGSAGHHLGIWLIRLVLIFQIQGQFFHFRTATGYLIWIVKIKSSYEW